MTTIDDFARSTQDRWLTSYYLSRAAFSAAWVASALTLGQHYAVPGAILLVIYPFWDAGANYVDAVRNGGLARNRTQAFNVFVSLATTVAVLAALQIGLSTVLTVFGAWAILSGLLQLGTAVRRWKSSGAQWAMALSGGQSALAGAFFVVQAQQPVPAVIPVIAGYAAFGAVYFLVSAISLVIGRRLRKQR
ncbi:DUF308 domain-containing protein [Devosia nitrariae]|uniref:Membrane protein n=1 Tax=Devosia nitrariae TaxID=2071872 RepID=A0ABQ5W2E5_9HYPH|nr:DUF308 domain-containing protein [Devosia nitrariae]GLQ53903.1 membrane protein [Devosia nitrariae]